MALTQDKPPHVGLCPAEGVCIRFLRGLGGLNPDFSDILKKRSKISIQTSFSLVLTITQAKYLTATS
jgi:hypothetical protein